MTKKLTKPQKEFLDWCRAYTYADGSGYGYILDNGHQFRMATRLEARGLVTVPHVPTCFNGVKITEKGRQELLK